MAKIYKGKDQKEAPRPVKTAHPVKLSMVVLADENNNTHFIHSLNKLRGELSAYFEMILITEQGIPSDDFEKDPVFRDLNEKQCVKIIGRDPSHSNVKAALAGIRQASGEFVTVIDTASLQKPLLINDLFYLKKDKADIPAVYTPDYEPEKNRKKKAPRNTLPVIMPVPLAISLFGLLTTKNRNFREELSYILKKSGVSIVPYNIHQADPFRRHNNNFFECMLMQVSSFFNWFFRVPLKEMNNKDLKLSRGESSLFRLIFACMAPIMLVAMMIMGYHAGMSGDEHFHYDQANKVLNYYTSFGKDTAAVAVLDPKGGESTLKFYGQSFDLLTVIFIKIFHVENIYETRHVFNSIFGWLAILFCALIAVEIAGWRAGVIGLLLLFISPGFLGHSFNNPKDVPFAMGYIMCIYFMIRFFKEFPSPSLKSAFWVAFAIGVAISIRVAGVLQIAYLFLFAALYFIFRAKSVKSLLSKENTGYIKTIFFYCCGISIAGYIMGILPWPYALESPVKNPLTALTAMNKFAVSLRQIFEGDQIWSDKVPWYYSSKYILITVPVIVIAGALSFFAFLLKKHSRLQWLFLFILFFAFGFPLFYIAYQHANVFGGWRHVLFVYPPMVSMAAVGLGFGFNSIKKKYLAWILAAIILLLSVKPFVHIIRNYPYQYVYFNEFTGGVKGAYGKYETDYYYHGLKGGCEWFEKNIKTDTVKTTDPIIVASNHTNIVSYWLRDLIKKGKVKIVYARYYERGNSNWDYYIAANSYLNPFQLVHKIFPPKNTIYTVTVEGAPICAVLKRTDKSDYLGFAEENKNNPTGAVELLEKSVRILPDNEAALLNLTEIYYKLQDTAKSQQYLNKLLAIYPDYENAINYQGWLSLSRNEPDKALSSFKRIQELNFKYFFAYYGAANAYLKMNDVDSAIGELEKALEQNNAFKPAYVLLGNIYQYKAGASSQKGDQQLAQDYMNKANEYMSIAKQLP